MSVGFGFSAGDFISALNLVSTVITALQDAGGVGSEFRELMRELYTLESALIRVKDLELEDSQSAQRVALRHAASQCQRTIDEFWKRTQKYQTHLSQSGHGAFDVKGAWTKVKWALYKKEDLVRFKADLEGHARGIGMLLITVQMEQLSLQGRKQNEQHATLNGAIQAALFQLMGRLSAIGNTVGSGIEQGKQLIQVTEHIMRLTVHVFQMVHNIQHILINGIPNQVALQQPVHFVDALGRHSSFSLDFIGSKEAFLAVLADNLRNTKTGPQKIARGEFVIQESQTKRRIVLSRNWASCFLPGQRVEMSMAFQRPAIESDACPGCKPILVYFRLDPDLLMRTRILSVITMKRRARLPRLWEVEGPTQTYAGEIDGTKSPSALSGSYPAHVGMSESNLINPDDDILSFRRVVIVHTKTRHNNTLDPIVERHIVERAINVLLDMVKSRYKLLSPRQDTLPFLNIGRILSFGLKSGLAYVCLVEPNALQCLRSCVRDFMQGTGGNEENGEGFLEEVEEYGYEVYEYAKRATKGWDKATRESWFRYHGFKSWPDFELESPYGPSTLTRVAIRLFFEPRASILSPATPEAP